MTIAPSHPEVPLLSEADQNAVHRQLEQLLTSSFFVHSKRFPNLLRYVVEQTLQGDGAAIKERTIGVEIFGRSADYETGSDPIVRVTAAEIRKRLGQYYADPAHRDELRIQLPIGSYTPQFEFPSPQRGMDISTQTTLEADAAQPASGVDGEPLMAEGEAIKAQDMPATCPAQLNGAPAAAAALPARSHARRLLPFALTALLACTLTAGAFLIHEHQQLSAFSFFWGPLLDDPSPALLCVSDQLQDTGILLRDASNPDQPRWHAFTARDNGFTTIALDNVNLLLALVPVLQANHKTFQAKSEQSTSFADLRSAPAIFVGGFDNAWTLRLVNKLRFRFANDPEMHFPRIVDSFEPGKPGWVSDLSQVGSTGSYQDYGIVARLVDHDTGRPAIIVAGIGRCASLAVGQFVSTPANLHELEQIAHAAGNKPNLEMVFSSQVVDGHPGSPKILAFYSW